MREERVEVDGIPAKLYAPPGADALLLLGHGGGYGKDSLRFVELSRRYAARTGLAVLCIDAVGHGERRPAAATPGIPAGWHSATVDAMVADWASAAAAFASIGPASAYVGFSLGSIFGLPVVAAMPTIRAAVFVVGGIPTRLGIDDPRLGPVLIEAGSRIEHAPVLMLNKTADEIFPTEGTRAVFDAIPGSRNQLRFWEGGHNDWPPEMIDVSIDFITQLTSSDDHA